MELGPGAAHEALTAMELDRHSLLDLNRACHAVRRQRATKPIAHRRGRIVCELGDQRFVGGELLMLVEKAQRPDAEAVNGRSESVVHHVERARIHRLASEDLDQALAVYLV